MANTKTTTKKTTTKATKSVKETKETVKVGGFEVEFPEEKEVETPEGVELTGEMVDSEEKDGETLEGVEPEVKKDYETPEIETVEDPEEALVEAPETEVAEEVFDETPAETPAIPETMATIAIEDEKKFGEGPDVYHAEKSFVEPKYDGEIRVAQKLF